MKILTPFEKIFTPYILLALNFALILAAEFIGGGTYFAETGLVHGIAIVFVILILIRIFTDYAFSDHILRGFLKIQLSFFLLLGMVHVYEYLGLYVLDINEVVVESTAVLAYIVWLIGNIFATEWVFRIYRQSTSRPLVFSGVMISLVALLGVALHFFSTSIHEIPEWTHGVALSLLVVSAGLSIWRLNQIKEIMPVFANYARYTVPAVTLVVVAAFAEYAESEGFLREFGISDIQNLYISHFLIYAALSLLLIGFGKLKKPQGIYADM